MRTDSRNLRRQLLLCLLFIFSPIHGRDLTLYYVGPLFICSSHEAFFFCLMNETILFDHFVEYKHLL